MASSSKREDLFASIPKVDPHAFEPPAWAKDMNKRAQTGGEASSSTPRDPPSFPSDDEDSDEDIGDIWEDALEAHEPMTEPEFLKFTDDELQRLFDKGMKEKEAGNVLFTASPPQTDEALTVYKQGLDYLPACPKAVVKEEVTIPPPLADGGIQEITEDEAEAIERAEAEKNEVVELSRREEIEEKIRQLQKVLWANVGACHTREEEHKDTVKACTKSLEIDADYIKALQRRAHASEQLGTSTGLQTAKEDHTRLLRLLPPNTPSWSISRRALASLPNRIVEQQTKEKDEMLGKLKDLGNSLLGNFGLNTDMFKFEQQPGGGYGLKFER